MFAKCLDEEYEYYGDEDYVKGQGDYNDDDAYAYEGGDEAATGGADEDAGEDPVIVAKSTSVIFSAAEYEGDDGAAAAGGEDAGAAEGSGAAGTTAAGEPGEYAGYEGGSGAGGNGATGYYLLAKSFPHRTQLLFNVYRGGRRV